VPQRHQIAYSFLTTGEEGLAETLVYPYAKLHGITYQNTVIFNDQKHILPTVCMWPVWLIAYKRAREYRLLKLWDSIVAVDD
jgi:hypothetical protein